MYSLQTENRPDALVDRAREDRRIPLPAAGPVEEIIFYDHPSVERRVLTAMEWKAAHPSSDALSGNKKAARRRAFMLVAGAGFEPATFRL